jgi:hypothetical protein
MPTTIYDTGTGSQVIDTGTGTQANQVIAAAQARLGQTVPNSNWCANFLTEVFKSAGLASTFSASSWVPTLVKNFSAKGTVSTDLTTAKPGDLIVFGNSEHVMLYEGSSQVIGTATDMVTGITHVVEVPWNSVYTVSGAKGPSMVLHTNLGQGGLGSGTSSAPLKNTLYDFLKISNPADLGLPTVAANNYFRGIAVWLNPNAPQVTSYQDVLNANTAAIHSLYGPGVYSLNNGQPYWTQEQVDFLKQVDSNTPINQITVPNTIATTMAGTLKISGFQNLWGGVDPTQGKPIIAPTDIAGFLGGLADTLGKLTNPANWLHLGAMVIGVGLVGFGMWTVTKDLHETGPQGLVSPMPIMLKEGS